MQPEGPCAGPLRPDEVALHDSADAQARVLFWIAATVVAASVAWLVWAWPTMPARMPQHTGLDGPDSWVDKGRWLGMTVAIQGLLAATTLAGPCLLAKIPMDVTNSAHPDYWKTPERYPISLKLVARFWYIVMGLTYVMAFASDVAAWWAGLGHPYPQAVMPIALGALFSAMVIEIIRMLRRLRPPAWWKECRAHQRRGR